MAERSESTKKTYRYLRLGIATLPVFLGAALVINMVWQGNGGCFDSISAYYYTTVRNVFVGTLVAMGLGLIAIQGRFLEDLFLDLAGMFAVVVALVPTPLADATRCDGQTVAPVEPSVRNGVGALLVVGLVALVVGWVVVAKSGDEDGLKPKRLTGMAVASVLFAVFAAWFSLVLLDWHKELFLDGAHFVSAGAMFVLIVVVVLVNSRHVTDPDRRTRMFSNETFRRLYRSLAVFMTGVLVVAVVCLVYKRTQEQDLFANWLLYVEIALLVAFSAFWGLQTADYWDDGVPDEPVRRAGTAPRRSRPDPPRGSAGLPAR